MDPQMNCLFWDLKLSQSFWATARWEKYVGIGLGLERNLPRLWKIVGLFFIKQPVGKRTSWKIRSFDPSPHFGSFRYVLSKLSQGILPRDGTDQEPLGVCNTRRTVTPGETLLLELSKLTCLLPVRMKVWPMPSSREAEVSSSSHDKWQRRDGTWWNMMEHSPEHWNSIEQNV